MKRDPQAPVLTARQYAVLYHGSRGETVAGTARRLGIGRDTVREHRKAMRERLGARNMADATGIAIRRGMLP